MLYCLHIMPNHSIGMNSRGTQLKFGCPRMSYYGNDTIMAASQLHVLANENDKLAGAASKLHKSA